MHNGTTSGGHYEPMKSPFTLLIYVACCAVNGDIPPKVKAGDKVCAMSTVLFNVVVD